MKKLLFTASASIILTGAITLSLPAIASSNLNVMEQQVHFIFNGQEQSVPSGYTSMNYNSHIYVPARFLAEQLGAQVDWDQNSQTVVINSQSQNNSSPGSVTNYNLQIIQKRFHLDNPDETITYPEIQGLPDLAVQDKINSKLKESVFPKSIPFLKAYSADYTITYQKENILNIVFQTYVDTGGAHGLPNKISLIFDLRTGNTYSLKDLMLQNSDFYKQISDIIRKQDVDHLLDIRHPFPGVNEKDGYGFYLENTGFVIYFYPYEYTPYAAGFPTFHIPYNDVSFIDPKSQFWKAVDYPSWF